ncbi:metal-sulfur cluster assembly factor [Salisediminibacterium halotolerans]|uniref:Metal-sulfur cluster biosynthetic enzyme n=1 Tax=Salisediminibacterium halotolerans TaxID=517425 RepID=A0A1H9TT27_9BACI|nr:MULTISPECIES: metal-sulfur cluster assembly factor [Salisediminibacterium]RLJ75556.1 metal-sulfur cluster biosynthetic enzyme [Actinophytocola xinjiangensis]RPE89409.1 metal-sulfur cluster biosynthetic enzyme [Salisediminibacterium halotolerans]TWG36169.1 metal-sulfur cluster biosynthetic enzyme [Salisediminibacterium halotolerans]SES00480.1 Metal-sulfur cluster biosynthetic enzyme [Salisediminibacterium haloalkalitolerans]GEL07645.1 DNA methyltransferase [Salisediminibacterium halotolerans
MSDEKQELKERIMAELENVIDPELGIDIVNLGLVYEIHLDDSDNVEVEMTLTAMGCPLAGTIVSEVKNALSDLQEIREIGEVDVNIVWSPPWDKSMMSRYAKIALGVAE